MNNLHVKFDNDWVKTLACIVPKMFLDSAKCDLGLWPPWLKFNRVPPLIMNNLHVEFESDQEKTVVCIVSPRQSATYAWMDGQTDARSYPLAQPHKNDLITISRPTLLRVDSIACIVPKRFCRQSAKFDIDLWPCEPKSIGFLHSSWITYMWSLKAIALKL